MRRPWRNSCTAAGSRSPSSPCGYPNSPTSRRTPCSGLLQLWRDLADVTQHGTLEVSGAERGYDLVRAHRPDLARTVVAIYAPVVVDLDPAGSTTILNATHDRRLVVRTPGPITGVTVRAADARPIAAAPATTSGGLVELTVPAFGSITVHT